MVKESTPVARCESPSPDLLLFDDFSIFGLSTRRIAALAAAITWVPLIVLAAVQGLAWGPTRAESAILDPAMFARFLVALPILILAPYKCSQSIGAVARHFLQAGLVKETDRERFSAIVSSGMKLRNSRVAVWFCLGLAYAYSTILVRSVLPAMSASWRNPGSAGHASLSFAGWWFVGVSQPIFLFVLLRFLYRTGLWWQFLWRTSRLNLQLHAVHPDRAGGLGFLGLTLLAFRVPAFAISASVAGSLANLVLVMGARVHDLRYEFMGGLLTVVSLFVAPLFFFYYRELLRTQHRDVLSYWALVEVQQRQFDQRWMGSEERDMLGVADFSEATDLSSILERAQRMTLLPFQTNEILPLVAAALVPFLLALALEIPVMDILKALLNMTA
jgi:hypothetical protein